MQKFSYKTMTFTGLIGVLGANICFCMTIQGLPSLLITLLFSTLGMYCGKVAFAHLSLKLWTSLNSLLAFYGALLANLWQGSFISYLGCAFIGFAAGTMFFVLPGNLIITWFHKNKFRAFSCTWGMAVFIGAFLSLWFDHAPVTTLMVCLGLTQLSIMPLKKFPATYKNFSLQNPAMDNKKLLSLSLFVLFLSISGGFMTIASLPALGESSKWLSLILGAILSPLSIEFFSERKGIYSSCILFIFLSELCVMFLNFYPEYIFIEYIGFFLLGGIFTSPLCLYPLLCYYMFGLGGYNGRLSRVMIFMPLGYLIAFLLPINREDMFSFAFFAILCSFFAVFSAWKHRLVLLKSH